MPLYGSAVKDVCPGENKALFDGTETAEAGLKSAAIARGTQGSTDAGSTFQATGQPADCRVTIQASNDDVDTHYMTVGLMPVPDANGNSFYTDTNRFAFYRAILSTFGGASPSVMPTVLLQR